MGIFGAFYLIAEAWHGVPLLLQNKSRVRIRVHPRVQTLTILSHSFLPLVRNTRQVLLVAMVGIFGAFNLIAEAWHGVPLADSAGSASHYLAEQLLGSGKGDM